MHGDQISSKQHRLPAEKQVLKENGGLVTACQLQGSLFFGTTDQLLNELEDDLKKSRYVILDMSRVQSVDFTAVHMLQQIEAALRDRNGRLLFAGLPASLPTGRHLETYFRQLDLITPTRKVPTYATLDEAVEWVEDRILEEAHATAAVDDRPLGLHEMDLFSGCNDETVEILQESARSVTCNRGEAIFKTGDAGDELFLIRKGLVRISLPLAGGGHYNITTFARGDFFGDMAFLDAGTRSADATAVVPTELFAISRRRVDDTAREQSDAATRLFAALARALAIRLRHADSELRALHES
jgi:SulP family sulfate permease